METHQHTVTWVNTTNTSGYDYEATAEVRGTDIHCVITRDFGESEYVVCSQTFLDQGFDEELLGTYPSAAKAKNAATADMLRRLEDELAD